MKHLLTTLFLFCSTFLFAQRYQVQHGYEVKLKKGTASMDILSADKNGVFFTETSRTNTGKLIRFDNNYKKVFEKEYKKDLDGNTFNGLQMLDDKIILLATGYDRGSKMFTVYAAEADKETGELSGGLKNIGQYTEEKRRDKYEIKARKVNNGKNVLVVTNISNKEQQSIGISLLNAKLEPAVSAIIRLSYTHNEFDLEDVIYTADDKIVLMGRQNELTTIGKKKRQSWVFKQYRLLIYSKKGRKEKDLVIDADNRYLLGGKLVEQPGAGLMLAGFYSNTPAKKNISGFFISKINSADGSITLSSVKEINSGMAGEIYETEETNAKQSQEAASAEGEGDDLSPSFTIRTVDISPVTGDILITGEVFQYSFWTTEMFSPGRNGFGGSSRTVYHHQFDCGEMLVIKSDKNGLIQWLSMLPKKQVEYLSTRKFGYYQRPEYGSFFANTNGLPYYSSYSTHIERNNMYLLMNDHVKNNTLPALRNSVKKIVKYPKESALYGITVNLQNGEMKKLRIADNDKNSIYMPRYSFFTGNTVYMPSMDEKMIGKSDFRINKIEITP